MSWKAFQPSLSRTLGLPPMLIATELNPSCYTIYLTDLVSVWGESLSRSQIIQRSLEENTSIDPHASDQLSILISKLGLGLTGAPGTNLDLTVVNENTNSQVPSLNLHVHVDLPGGIAALEWPVRLSLMPKALLTNQFTLPLLKNQYHTREDLNALIQMVKEKDHVIEKLLQKLEEQGIDLGHVFPRAAGKPGKKLNRNVAEQKVKGLAKFEFEPWKKSREMGHDPDNIVSLIVNLFGNESAQKFDAKFRILPGEETWWKNIKGNTINLGAGGLSSKCIPQPAQKTKVEKKIFDNDSSDSDVDAFEIAAAPKKARRNMSEVTKADLDKKNCFLPTPQDQSSDFYDKDVRVVSKLAGEFTGKDTQLIEEHFTPVDHNEYVGTLKNVEVESLSMDTSQPIDDKSPSSSTLTSTLEKRPQGKLGVLKGKKPSSLPHPGCKSSESSSNSVNKSPEASFQAPARKKPKLGTIMGKKLPAPVTENPTVAALPSPSTSLSIQGAPITSIKTPVSSAHKHENIEPESLVKKNRETAQEVIIDPKESAIERANRKRAELRRETDARMQNQVAQKKKRRF